MILTFVILVVTILLFVSNKLRPDVVAMLSLLALFLTGILTVGQSLAGFADSTVIMVAALFVVGEGLAQTGITAWLGQRLTGWAGDSQRRLLVALMVGTAVLSAFLSNTGTIAMLLPAVLTAVWRLKSLPSRFLIPMAFAASLGGMMTLIGTPPNIVIADTLTAAGLEPFGFFEYAKIGVPLFLAALAYIVWVGQRLLPARQAVNPPTDVNDWMSSVVDVYGLDTRLFRLRILPASSLAGKTLADAGLGSHYHLSVVAVEHGADGGEDGKDLSDQERRKLFALLKRPQGGGALPGPQTTVQAGDVLLVKGARQQVELAMLALNVSVQEVHDDADTVAGVLLSPEIGVAEVLLAPRAECLGNTVAEAQIAEKYRVQVLSILRGSRTVSRQETRLQFGDSLLVRGTWADIGLLRNESQNFVVAGAPESMATQIARFSPRTFIAAGALLLMVILMVTSTTPTVIAVLIAAMIMVLGGCVPMDNVYRVINWQTVVLIAATLPLSTALQVTGGAQLIVDTLVQTVGALGPIPLMAVVFLLTAAFSQVISNTATTVLIAPIVLQMATTLGVSPYPLLIMVAVGASSAFLTPIASPVNTLVMTPGSYQFNDYFKVGFPLLLITMVISLVLAPMLWPL